MSVKMGDMVIYNGRTVRLMTHRDSATRLTHFGIVDCNLDDLILAKSTILPNLKEGDLVVVDDIPQEEKDNYITRWDRYKENIVTSKEYYKIDMVMKTDYHGLVAKIDNEWFAAYHIVPVMDYDMI